MLSPADSTNHHGDEHDDVSSEALPWHVVASFLPWSDIASLRLTSQAVFSKLYDSISLETCARLLSKNLQARNLYVAPHGPSWKDAAYSGTQDGDQEALESFVSQCTSSPMDVLIRCFRVFYYLPQEIVLGASGKYGRHCMGWDSTKQEFQVYDRCHRGKQNCPTCRIKIPEVPLDYRDEEDDGYILIRTPGGRLDLSQCWPKCIPNLPSTLSCPKCNTTDRRTLVVCVFSYQTEPGTERRDSTLMSLTLTPQRDEDEDEGEQASDPTLFPPRCWKSWHRLYAGVAALLCKYSAAIHCEHCQWAVLAPVHRIDNEVMTHAQMDFMGAKFARRSGPKVASKKRTRIT